MLPCHCETHTYGLNISRPDLTFKAECLKAQAEIEHKAAAYDALVEACKKAKRELEEMMLAGRNGLPPRSLKLTEIAIEAVEKALCAAKPVEEP